MKSIYYLLFLMPLLFSCKNDPSAKLSAEIESLEAKMAASNTMDPKMALELIDKYKQQAGILNNEMSSTLLFRAGQVANGIKDYQQAIALWEEVITKYPNGKEAAGALFSQAFTCDYYIKDTEKAKALYEMFISRFPNDELASQARVSIENLGKSPEELLKSVIKQQ